MNGSDRYNGRMMTRGQTLLVLLLAGLSTAARAGADQHAHGGPVSEAHAVVPMKSHVGLLPELPPISFEPSRPMAVVHQIYEFAARHPEVLQYVPCYCGCERIGHNGNHDCFVKKRSAAGRVTEWDPHGMGCAICLDVAVDAMTMFNGGSSAAEIRAAIARKSARFRSSTPTPRPPAAK